MRIWIDKTGNKRKVYELIVSGIQFISSPREKELEYEHKDAGYDLETNFGSVEDLSDEDVLPF